MTNVSARFRRAAIVVVTRNFLDLVAAGGLDLDDLPAAIADGVDAMTSEGWFVDACNRVAVSDAPDDTLSEMRARVAEERARRGAIALHGIFAR